MNHDAWSYFSIYLISWNCLNTTLACLLKLSRYIHNPLSTMQEDALKHLICLLVAQSINPNGSYKNKLFLPVFYSLFSLSVVSVRPKLEVFWFGFGSVVHWCLYLTFVFLLCFWQQIQLPTILYSYVIHLSYRRVIPLNCTYLFCFTVLRGLK